MNDYAERMRQEALSCPARSDCPLAFLCASRVGGDRYALPTFIDFDYGQMAWTDLTLRPCVLVVRSGLLISKAYGNDGVEIPFCMFGKGTVSGIAEIYGAYAASNFNFLSGLVPGRLCSFDASFVEECLNALPSCEGQRLTTRITLNHTTSTYGQLLTLSHAKARDRVVSVLMRLDRVLEHEGGYGHVLPVTHDDIALIASLRRTTVSGELKALADEGLLRLGYRRIELDESLRRECDHLVEAKLPFYSAS